jgi:hypothetical protein
MPDPAQASRSRLARVASLVGVAAALLALVLGLWIWQPWNSGNPGIPSTGSNPPATPSSSPGDPGADSIPRPEPPALDPSNLPPSPLNDLLARDTTPTNRLQIVGQLFRDYYSVFHALPTGTQEEIFARFTGDNPRDIEYYPKDHPAVNDAAIPLNADGLPLVIHIISASEGIFEVRDPGPDQAAFTDDDLVLLSPQGEIINPYL